MRPRLDLGPPGPGRLPDPPLLLGLRGAAASASDASETWGVRGTQGPAPPPDWYLDAQHAAPRRGMAPACRVSAAGKDLTALPRGNRMDSLMDRHTDSQIHQWTDRAGCPHPHPHQQPSSGAPSTPCGLVPHPAGARQLPCVPNCGAQSHIPRQMPPGPPLPPFSPLQEMPHFTAPGGPPAASGGQETGGFIPLNPSCLYSVTPPPILLEAPQALFGVLALLFSPQATLLLFMFLFTRAEWGPQGGGPSSALLPPPPGVSKGSQPCPARSPCTPGPHCDMTTAFTPPLLILFIIKLESKRVCLP